MCFLYIYSFDYFNTYNSNIMIERIIKMIPYLTAFLIALILSGKIVPIENGTHQGGLTGAIGVGVVIIAMFALSFILAKIQKRRGKSQ